MSDLTEFLLARLAEDEAWVHRDGRFNPAPGRPTMPGERARVLADVAAKRRIVEDFEVLHRDYRETHDPSTEARRFQARIAMAHLATVYADHPDYREEWRP